MKKGFDFWSSEEIASFLRKYWIIYGVFDLLAIIFAIITKNPFMFLIIGFLPCPIIWIYRYIHNPLYNLEENIAKYDSQFHKLLLDLSSKLPSIRIATSDSDYEKARLYAELMRADKSNIDQRILTYIRNNKSINWSGTISLAMWFVTFMILLLVLFYKN